MHLYIFVMESLTWTSPRTRATFGTTAEEAETTKLLAFNQGFYNLFLAVVSGVGIVAIAWDTPPLAPRWSSPASGRWLAAAVVLLVSSPDKARAAFTQGVFPLVAVLLLVVALATQ